jgi:hypothetical protein
MTAAPRSTAWCSRQREPGVTAELVLELEPHRGFGPLKLGAAREDARATMAAIGFPLQGSQVDPLGQSQTEIDLFCEGSVKIESVGGRISFIDVFYSDAYVAQYRGVDVFDVTARELFQIAAAADKSGHHEFDPLEYRFPKQILTLWSADPQYDYRRKGARQVWGAVGLGNEVYLSAIQAVEKDLPSR